MLYSKLDSNRYRGECISKLSNFLEKSPILASFVTTEAHLKVIHENTQKEYTFYWDYNLPIKLFIHNVKEVLVENHYPRLLQVINTDINLTPGEQANLLEDGCDIQDLPSTKTVRKEILWRIERVIVKKDIIIIENEETAEQYRYQMNSSCIFFLKKYRSGVFKSLEEAWNYFQSHSTLMNKIELRA